MNSPTAGSSGQPPVVIVQPDDPAPTSGECGVAEAKATLERESVDIVIVVDNSGSMSEEIVGIQDNINVNFANILKNANIDYRVVLISQYGSAVEQRHVCISAPLSGAPSCDPLPPKAVFSDRFFQYEGKVRSNNSLHIVLGAYRLDPLADSDDVKEYRDLSGVSSVGWHEYLRPGARKVFLELTDDDATGITAEEFDRKLLELDPAQFGSASARNYVWHSIVGMAEKPDPKQAYLATDPVQPSTCGDVTAPGVTFQELSRLTGGLRFPLCRPDAYDAVFQSIASDVIDRVHIACEFAIPAPPTGETLDLEKVAVAYAPSAGAVAQQYGQVVDLASCQPDTFYVKDGQISLCPETCARLQQNPMAEVKVLFTCDPTLVK